MPTWSTPCGSVGLVAAVPLTTVLAVSLLSGPADDPDPATPDDDLHPTAADNAVQDRPAPKWSDFAPADELDL